MSSGSFRLSLPKITLKHPRPDVLEIAFEGHINGKALDDLLKSLPSDRVRDVLFDASGVTNYDIDVRGPGLELLKRVKALGVEKAVAVAHLGSVRMIATALTFAAGLPMEFVESRTTALMRLG